MSEFGNLAYLPTAETMDLSSDDAADITAGAGTAVCICTGLDGAGVVVSETYAMNGLSLQAGTQLFSRMLNMLALDTGGNESNAGAITAIASGSATVQGRIAAGDGLSQNAHYTVPLGHTLHADQVELNVVRNAGGLVPKVQLLIEAKKPGLSWVSTFSKSMDASVENDLIFPLPTPTKETVFTQLSDIRVRVSTNQDDTEVKVRLSGVLIDNSV